MKSTILKSAALVALLSVSGVSYAQEQAISVNTEGMPEYLAATTRDRYDQYRHNAGR